MSVEDVTFEASIPAGPPAIEGRRGGPWAWVAVGCILLGASGAARTVQERRHNFEREYKDTCPIDLAKIPTKFGDWKLIDGGERQLDPLTMRITGGTDHLIRTYANDQTGVSITALLLFGPADPVSPHTPQVCYPSSGFSETEAPTVRSVEYSPGLDAEKKPIVGQANFLSASYAKPAGRVVLREAVYHSFRLDGQWSPFVSSSKHSNRRNPGIFKLQVQRLTAEGESLGKGDPIEQFLATLLAQIEADIKAAGPKPPSTN